MQLSKFKAVISAQFMADNFVSIFSNYEISDFAFLRDVKVEMGGGAFCKLERFKNVKY